ncbi:MAG TPA: hypothetical protein EYP25_00445 [Anaerolineae bacterium]|nr:hypothetical protein [Anaerolineae bacterium]HIQ11524.1 hypothetical protein [Caldilineales bacterium]
MHTAPRPDSDALAAQRAQARKRLNRAWFAFLMAGVASMAAMFWALQSQWESDQLKGWFLVTALALFYELRIFKQALPLMRLPDEEALADRIDGGVALTLAAGLGYALLAGLLMVPQPAGALGWLATALTLAALFADAWAEKRVREGDALVGGGHLAREFRALGALVITVVGIHYGKLPSWLLAVGFMEYLILFTASWMARQGAKVSAVGIRTRTIFLLNYLAVAGASMAPIFHPDVAAVISVMTGAVYGLMALRDWLKLSGAGREKAS